MSVEEVLPGKIELPYLWPESAIFLTLLIVYDLTKNSKHYLCPDP